MKLPERVHAAMGVEISNALYELATLNNKGEAYDEGYPAFREGIF